jgi:hypothetical protein
MSEPAPPPASDEPGGSPDVPVDLSRSHNEPAPGEAPGMCQAPSRRQVS